MRNKSVWTVRSLALSSVAAAALVAACGGGDGSDAGAPGDGGNGGGTDWVNPGTLAEWPRLKSAVVSDPAIEAKVEALLTSMSLAEKVGQMTQVEIQDVTPEEIRRYHIGSVLNGGGSFPNRNKGAAIADWLARADELWAASMDPAKPHRIPLIWGTDAVHGHSNVKGATFFPHNIGLGATRDPALIRRIGEITAREVARTGIDWTFAPTLAVVRDDRWGRTYEGYSEDPQIVAQYASQMVQGLQGALGTEREKVVATAKHYLGDGGTLDGDDQGITHVSESELINIHARGYFPALEAGAQTVMSSFSSWKDKAGGDKAPALKMHGHTYLLTEVLKVKMGFDGFVISDWNGLGQLTPDNSDAESPCSNSHCPAAINAGIDMVMVPARADWQAFIANTIASVEKGEIARSRIDDAVRRILRVKFRAGLFDKPKPSARITSQEVGSAEHRATAREAVRKSLVLLKNNAQTLPLARNAKLLVAGKSADSLENQTGGWSLSWQGTGNSNADFGGGTTVWGAIRKIAPNAELDTSADGTKADSSHDAAIVVIGETPYAEGNGDLGKSKTLELAKLRPEDLALIESLKAKGVKKIVTLLMSGRPLYVNKELNRSDAFVAAWLPGTEGDGVADVLFKTAAGAVHHDFSGKLSYSWPRSACQVSLNRGDASYDPLYAYGYGMRYAEPRDQPAYDEASPEVGCGIENGGGTADQPLSLFAGGMNEAGWSLRLGAPSHWGVPVALAGTTVTSTPGGEISTLPVDDRGGIQWAAVKATWHNNTGEIFTEHPGEALDLLAYANSNGALVFDLKVLTPPSSTVTLRVDCGYPCTGAIDATAAMKSAPVGEWKELAIPLSCFADQGADLTAVNKAFLLSSSGTLELAIAGIRWEPNKTANVSCSGAPTN
ncbi:exo 1,3/1,4-beta-D-glucan glucohydrolase [Aquabacterium sp. A7-Y]|uniref:glycoside hydrolase family 3 protein n=1 Tax=Aquabacterium sp. A7-Y TaxID=1349605 RepID=UPI00223E3AE2|nr:exo 1,3/1,4-beta-D-glucan glucohydrolase [Aquabacterium sp. A7-Y]MCW7539131.1 exo 1,3/1,4-beta-D-glucan glucohydrolase [Aquabacterium sp. A7-Y]